ncbi:peptidoglycan DD-metalloendopeptidase family protein [Heliobacterium undosum]|uniref:Peptidoglycan DD-metalloendopeptidase family protein n=1 Tax=Heliomicrobium undosum TaxID=121734 RepID=A0A845L7A4_9FIRM|nr:peptidoglycan DD-metalloendopeptidase family protein [Heliomicrobium undosum]MZP31159.1 peptidoglycan DD-metalloendopeptidase family protein [Heliomicrobium undosum]
MDEQQAGRQTQQMINGAANAAVRAGWKAGSAAVRTGGRILGKMTKLALKKAALWLAGLIGLPALFALFIVILLLGVYAVVASGDLNYSKTVQGEDDRAVAKMYSDTAEEVNKHADVEGKLTTLPPISVGALENRYYLDWPMVYAADLYEMQIKRTSFSPKATEKAAVLAPRFLYKPSTIVVCCPDPDGGSSCDTESVYLLIMADTYKATYVHSYVRVTESSGKCSITYDKLVGIEEVPETKWKRLDAALLEWYQEKPESAEVIRQLTLLAAEGVAEQKPWLAWLLDREKYIQSIRDAWMAEIPPEYIPWFQDAADKYALCHDESGKPVVDWAVLAAIAKIENSFRATGEGPPNHTGELGQGMMQFLPSTWSKFGVDADGDGKADPNSPKDAIYAAANYLNAELAKAGCQNLPKALWVYNNSDAYVQKVQQLANSYRWQEANGAGKYAVPIAGCWTVTDTYGRMRKGIPHHGLDLGAVAGTAIVACVGGEVILLDGGHYHNDGSIYGNQVVIRGDDGNLWVYAHMERFADSLRKNERVETWQPIGTVGNTGKSTGPHLHLEVRNGYLGNTLNPEILLFGAPVSMGTTNCN